MRISVHTKKARSLPTSSVLTEITLKEETKFIEKDGVHKVCVKVDRFEKNDRRKFIKAVRKIIRTAKQYKIKKISIDIDELVRHTDLRGKELGSIIAQNIEMAGYEFRAFKSEPKEGWDDLEEVALFHVSSRDLVQGIAEGIKIGQMVNECRSIANTPGGDMTPRILAVHAKRLSRNTPIKVHVLNKKEMERLKMGSILSVAKGSIEEPKFIVMEYWGAKKKKNKPIVLIGKGVTFDTGGINLKPSEALLGMHFDMSGGSAVIATVALAARLKLKKNVIGLVPSVENMPSGSSFRPGDVLTSMSGKTIEVIDTDAEGRLILADALTYAKRYRPRAVVDVATLTGAALVALGQQASAVMSRDLALLEFLIKTGEKTGDYLWPLPLWEEYEESIRGQVADVANLATKNPRYAGTINGGVFLQQFAVGFRFAHIDIAPRMTTVPSDYLANGAAGEPVRLLAKFIETF